MTGRELIALLLKYDLDAEVHFEVPPDYFSPPNKAEDEDELIMINAAYEIPADDVINEPWIVLTNEPVEVESLLNYNPN